MPSLARASFCLTFDDSFLPPVQPTWQRRTNVWREVTSPRTGPERCYRNRSCPHTSASAQDPRWGVQQSPGWQPTGGWQCKGGLIERRYWDAVAAQECIPGLRYPDDMVEALVDAGFIRLAKD